MIDQGSKVFKTDIIPATHLYQNHIDTVHNLLDSFCKANKAYSWKLLVDNRSVKTGKAVDAYLAKNLPKSVEYLVESTDESQTLLISIDNGIILNIKNGSHALYGLYNLILDTTSLLKVPPLAVFLRRYWIFNSIVSVVTIPTIIFFLTHHNDWAVGWLVFMFVVGVLAALVLFDTVVDDLEWDDVVLSTDIRYGQFSNNLRAPSYLLFTSTKSVISLITSVATVISFIYLFASK